MKIATKVSVALVVIASLGLAVVAFDIFSPCYPDNSVEASFTGDQPNSGINSSNTTLLAGRYHMRGRTSRFFQRSTRSSHSYRSNRYYRGKSIMPASRHGSVESQPAEKIEKLELAGRYHLRKRTSRFFRRGIA